MKLVQSLIVFFIAIVSFNTYANENLVSKAQQENQQQKVLDNQRQRLERILAEKEQYADELIADSYSFLPWKHWGSVSLQHMRHTIFILTKADVCHLSPR